MPSPVAASSQPAANRIAVRAPIVRLPGDPYPGLPGVAPGSIPVFPPPPKAIRPVLPGGPLAPALSRLATSQPVMFITIDDGIVRRPEARALIEAAHVPVTLFLISKVAAEDPAYFSALQGSGAVIEDHTINHPSLRHKPYALQHKEICESADKLGEMFGRRPLLFRPPYGEYDQNTRKAAHDCGMKALLTWREATNAGHVYYQTPVQKLHAGDIVLMHFRPAFVADFLAILKAAHDANLTPALLENYLA